LSTLMKTLICTAVIALLLVGFAASASGGDLTGRVTIGGVPADETIVVWIDGPVADPPAPNHAVITQSGIRFSPTFLVVVAGQTVDMSNEYNVAHNVYSMSATKKFNLGVYEKGQSRSVTFEKSGLVGVSCWLHKRMNASILGKPHRRAALGAGRTQAARVNCQARMAVRYSARTPSHRARPGAQVGLASFMSDSLQGHSARQPKF